MLFVRHACVGEGVCVSTTWPTVLSLSADGELEVASEGWLELSGLAPGKRWSEAFDETEGAVAESLVRAAATGIDMAPARLKLARGGGLVEAVVHGGGAAESPIFVSIRPLGLLPGDQYLHDLLEAQADGVATVQRSRDGVLRIVHANGRFCELMSMARHQVLGAQCTDILVSEADAVLGALNQAEATGLPVSLERSRTRGGQRRLIQSTFRPGVERVTGRSQVTIVIHDATHTVHAERAEGERRRQESLDIMAGGLAHELNNSLLAILGHIELAKEEHGDPSGNLGEARSAGVRATHLGKMLLDYTGHGHNVLAPIDVNEVVLARLTTVAATAGVGIEVVTRLREGLPVVEADGGQLGHCLMSLVNNSCEAMAGRGGRLLIATYEREVGAEIAEAEGLQAGRYVALAVSDTGPGIPGEQVDRVFEPFYTTRFLGRGLGLPSVRGILRAHDGAVLLETAVDVGTTVTLLIPASGERVD